MTNLPRPVYVDGLFPEDLPANAEFNLWARFDPEEVAGKDRKVLHELLLLPPSRRNDQMGNDLREVLMQQVRRVLKAHGVPDDASPIERVMPALVGNPWYGELMEGVAEEMAPRLRRLGLILDRSRPMQITRIDFSEHDRQSFTTARIGGVLRRRFPDLSDAKLIQVIAAFLGQPPTQVKEFYIGSDLGNVVRPAEPVALVLPAPAPAPASAAPPSEREHLSKHDLKVLKHIPQPDAAPRTG